MKGNLFKSERFLSGSYKISVISAVFLMLFSLVINYFVGIYATNNASNPVSDLILDNLPTFDVTFMFVYGFIIFCVFVFVLLIYNPDRLPFALKTVALFILIRSFFVVLTHIGPPPHTLVDFDGFNFFLKKLMFSGDLFFSGHTGSPFLMALIFWDKKYLRLLFVFLSAVFGATVLFGHLHYSIDVFASLFITFGVFRIAQKLFLNDFRLFFQKNC